MNGEQYMILAYVSSSTLLWGFAAMLWWEIRKHGPTDPVED